MYRCYHICNFYLSSIQQGIQSAHAQMELFLKYREDSPQKDMLYTWGDHKTMIVLNGGMLSDMEASLEFLSNRNNPYPYAPFYESKEALGGILTNVAIVLPERIYKLAEWIRAGKIIVIEKYGDMSMLDLDDHKLDNAEYMLYRVFTDTESNYTDYEIDLCLWLNKFGLAK